MIQKLAQIDDSRRRQITKTRTAAPIFRSVFHPHRQLAKVRFVMTGKGSAEESRIIRNHENRGLIIIYDLGAEKFQEK